MKQLARLLRGAVPAQFIILVFAVFMTSIPSFAQVITSFNVEIQGHSYNTFVSSINATGVITGNYIDDSGVSHGYVRDSQGNITTFDVDNSPGTDPISINAAGEITGIFNSTYDFVRDSRGNITTFRPDGSFILYAASINAAGVITGAYQDSNSPGIHGFVRGR